MTALLCFAMLTQPLFESADRCGACHNGLTDGAGRDISITTAWRASMMANAARDPYWQAAVRAEVLDHPSARAAIEGECATCHMPMARHTVHVADDRAEVFGALRGAGRLATLAADGASCTTCHQIQPTGFGTRGSFVGRFDFDRDAPWGRRAILGPHDVDHGRTTVMRSASAFEPVQATHLADSAMCATCHTLYTHSLDAAGNVVGELPEQVPFLEWQQSAYANERSCQSCHMPEVAGEVAITSVLALPRSGVSEHVFRGGNFFVLGLLNEHRGELAVNALGQDLERLSARTLEHLATSSARLAVSLERAGDTLVATVAVEPLTGHKLPSAYPSRRAWLHVRVTGDGALLFESGAPRADGAITGNDNDRDPAAFEPHCRRISDPEQVQIYEAILGTPDGSVTTGLLSATQYLKDNRLLPRGFDKATAPEDVAVRGAALGDTDFGGSGDRLTYEVNVAGSPGPFQVEVALLYQPIGYRWVHSLARHQAAETTRFVRYFEGASGASSTVVASSVVSVP